MKNKNFIAILLSLFAFFLFTCDQEDVDLGLNYQSMLEDAYQTTGEGKIIPVTVEQASELDGTITEDGKYLYFASDSDRGNFDIYMRSMRDITSVRITDHPSKDYAPAISPSGRYLAFVSNREDPEGDIYVISLRSRDLLKKAKAQRENVQLDLRPKNISQVKNEQTKNREVIRDQHPVWSPNSRKIAFVSTRGPEKTENIWICDRNGRNKEQITTLGATHPSFSPDGKKLIYVSYRNADNNGDIYIYDFLTKAETQITDSKAIEMYPSFIRDSDHIAFTLIDKDSNSDKTVDLNDNSVIQYRDLLTQLEYPLTYYSVSSFGAKWFSLYGARFANTDEFNYSGIIVYAQQFASNINLNIIPDYGVIPRKQSAREQYGVARQYMLKFNSYERYSLALLRVYFFFHNNSDEESVRYTTKALKNAYLDALQSGSSDDKKLVDTLFKKYVDGPAANEYSRVVYDYCTKEAARAQSVFVLENGMATVPVYYKPVVLEDIAEHYGESPAESKRRYQDLLVQYPDFDNSENIRFELAKIDSSDGNYLTENVRHVMELESDEKAMQIQVGIIRSFNRRKTADQLRDVSALIQQLDTLDLSAEAKKRYLSVFRFVEANALFISGERNASRQRASDAIALCENKGPVFYRASILMADISHHEQLDNEENHLYAAATIYDPLWHQSDYADVVRRLVTIYEEKGSVYERQNKHNSALETYEKYSEFLSFLKQNSDTGFENLYNEYGTRAHILFIDAYYRKHRQTFSCLENLEAKYLKNLKKARRSFDKAYLYGLGYLYTKQGIHLDTYYSEKGTLLGIERGSAAGSATLGEESIVRRFRSAVDTLNWSIFIDEEFSDASLLKGWIYQYIDSRRSEEASDETAIYHAVNKYFPEYLLEQNRDIYERAIALNNEIAYPEKEGNLYLNHANVCFMLTQYPDALQSYTAARKFKNRFSSQTEEALFYYHYGYCYWQTGDLESARNELGKTVQIYKNLGGGSITRAYAPQIARIYLYFALFDQLEEKYESSISWYENVLSIDEQYDIGVDRARHMQEIAYCMKEMKRYDEALSQIARTDRLLRTYPDKHRWYNVSFYFYNIPVIRYDIGHKAAVIGDARLNRDLDTYTKRLYNYSLREEIYTIKNDVSSVLDVQKRKIAWLKSDPKREKNYTIYNDARIVALNNLAVSYFRMRDYRRSEKYFNEAWEFAEDKGYNEGLFRTIQNMTNFYAHLLEKRDPYLSDPEKTLNDFIKEIHKYRRSYEKKKTAAAREALKKAHKEKGFPPPTNEEYQAAVDEVRKSADRIYYMIDINRAILDFYKAELITENYNREAIPRDAYAVLNRNDEPFQLYARSSRVFEASMDNSKVSNRMKIKLLLNASICRERMGAIKESYLLMGKAEDLAKKFRLDDLLFDTYSREAYFTEKNRFVLDLRERDVLGFYENAISLVRDFPQLYFDKQSEVNGLFDNYVRLLTVNAKPEFVVSVREQRRRINLINRMYAAGPVFSRTEDQDRYLKTGFLINEYIVLREQLNGKIASGAKENSADVVAILARMSDLKNSIVQINDVPGLFSSFVVMNKQSTAVNIPRDKAVVDFMYSNSVLVAWTITHKGVSQKSYTTNKPREQLALIISELQKNNTEVFIVAEEGSFSLPGDEVALVTPVHYIFSVSDLNYLDTARNSVAGRLLVVSRSIDEQMNEQPLVLQEYSSLADNSNNEVELTRRIVSGELRPSLTVKKYNRGDFDRIALMYYSTMYTGGKNFILYNGPSAIPVENGTFVFGSVADYSELNKSFLSPTGYAVFGRGGAVVADDAVRAEVSQRLLADFNGALYAGDIDDARYLLSQWKQINGESPELLAQYGLLSAKIDNINYEPMNAFHKLSDIRVSQLSDADLRLQIESAKLYYLFRAGNQSAAARQLAGIGDTDPFRQTNDFVFYTALSEALAKGELSVSVDGQFVIEPERLLSLMFSYQMLAGNRLDAEKTAGLIDISKLYEFEYLTISCFYPSVDTTGSPRDERVKKILAINDVSSTAQLHVAYRAAAEKNGVYDSYSRFALLTLVRRLNELDRSGMINVSLNASNVQAVMPSPGTIENLLVYKELESVYRKMHSYAVADEICSLGSSLASQAGFISMNDMFVLRKAELACIQGAYGDARTMLSSIAASARNVVSSSWAFNKYHMLFAEVSLRTNRRNDAVAALASCDATTDKLSRLALKLETELLSRETDNHASVFSEMIAMINADNTVLRECERPDIVDRSLAFYENYYVNLNEIAFALGISDLRHVVHTASYLAVLPPSNDNGGLSGEFPLEELRQSLAQDTALLVIDTVGEDLICYVISASSVSPYVLRGGYAQYRILQNSFYSSLLSVSSVDTVVAQYNQLFSELVGLLQPYKSLYCVLDYPVSAIPIEIMGGEATLYESTNILYMPSLSCAIAKRRNVSGESVALVQHTVPGFIDSIEMLSIKESGLDINKNQNSSFAHVQRELFYDVVSGNVYLNDMEYKDQLGGYTLVYLSSGSMPALDYSSIAAGLFTKNVTGVVVNRAQVRDVNSAIVSKRFYSSVRSGLMPDASFYNARLQLYKNIKYEHPAYWLYNRMYVSGFQSE